jgi:hypothetical protein
MGTNHTTTTPKACPKSSSITIPAPERFGDGIGRELTAVLDSAERSAHLLLGLAELLDEKGDTPLARIARVCHLEACRSADYLGEILGVEVNV